MSQPAPLTNMCNDYELHIAKETMMARIKWLHFSVQCIVG